MVDMCKEYVPLYTSKNRYFYVTGGRGSLKSSTIANFLVELTYEPGHGILATRYTMTSLDISVRPSILSAIERVGHPSHFLVTGKKIINTLTGSFILFSGIKTSSGDQTAKLKSLEGITTWFIDEAEDFTSKKSFDDIDNSIRLVGKQLRVIVCMNPTDRHNIFYKMWLSKSFKHKMIEGYKVRISQEKDVTHIHTTYKLGQKQGFLANSWLNKALMSKRNTPEDYGFDFIGQFREAAQGAILTNWKKASGKFPEHLSPIYGQDYGIVDPTTLVKYARDGEKVHVEELIYLADKPIQHIEKLMETYVTKTDFIIGDCAGSGEIRYLREEGWSIYPSVKPNIVESLKKLKYKEILVYGESSNLIDELNSYAWLKPIKEEAKSNKQVDVPVDKNNHGIDPIRYCEHYMDLQGA